MANHVLIVEDERNIAQLLQLYLEKEGYAVAVANDGGAGLAKFRSVKPDLVLLDVMMPVMDGWAVCKAIRADSQTPIIMLTAKGETNDKVTGLRSGADDYITKPFDILVLLARVEAVLRRTKKNTTRLTFGACSIDFESRTVQVDGSTVELTPQEYALLEALALNRNLALSREKLIALVWTYDYTGDTRTVDVHIQQLRQKLGLKDRIKTIYKVGYRFEL